jgi:hypothetical protein
MQPIVHFLLSLVAGFGVGLHLGKRSRKYTLIFLLALATCTIDMDHLLPVYHEAGIAIFHNFFVFILLPAVLFFIFFLYERTKDTSLGQRSFLVLSVMFLGAMLTDGISESGMTLFYPMNSQTYVFIDLGISLNSAFLTLTSGQVMLIIWGAIILGANFLETLIYNDVEGRVLLSDSTEKMKIRKKIKKWLPYVSGGIIMVILPRLNKK